MTLKSRAVLTAALLSAAGLLLPALAPAQDRPQFNREDGVPSELIREEGYVLRLSNGTEVHLTDVVTDGDPAAHCMVHIPSLRRQIERGLRTGLLEPIGMGAQTAKLQVLQDPESGELWCRGGGSGCSIVIE